MSNLDSYRLILNQEFIDKVSSLVLSNKDYEVGGWIFGKYEKNKIYVNVAERDEKAEESAVGLRIRSPPPIGKHPSLEIVGVWHTHPAGFASFSHTDSSTMERWVYAVTVSDIPKLKPKIYFISSLDRGNVDWAFFTPKIRVDMEVWELEKAIKYSKIQEILNKEQKEEPKEAEEFQRIRSPAQTVDLEADFSELGEKISQIIKGGEEKGILILKKFEGQPPKIIVEPYPSLFVQRHSYDEVFGVWFEGCGLGFSSVEKAFLLNFSKKIGRSKFLVVKVLEDKHHFREVRIKSDRYAVEIVEIPKQSIEIIKPPRAKARRIYGSKSKKK